jgi:hypothetical protein
MPQRSLSLALVVLQFLSLEFKIGNFPKFSKEPMGLSVISMTGK